MSNKIHLKTKDIDSILMSDSFERSLHDLTESYYEFKYKKSEGSVDNIIFRLQRMTEMAYAMRYFGQKIQIPWDIDENIRLLLSKFSKGHFIPSQDELVNIIELYTDIDFIKEFRTSKEIMLDKIELVTEIHNLLSFLSIAYNYYVIRENESLKDEIAPACSVPHVAASYDFELQTFVFRRNPLRFASGHEFMQKVRFDIKPIMTMYGNRNLLVINKLFEICSIPPLTH